jgi:hypothetical protein
MMIWNVETGKQEGFCRKNPVEYSNEELTGYANLSKGIKFPLLLRGNGGNGDKWIFCQENCIQPILIVVHLDWQHTKVKEMFNITNIYLPIHENDHHPIYDFSEAHIDDKKSDENSDKICIPVYYTKNTEMKINKSGHCIIDVNKKKCKLIDNHNHDKEKKNQDYAEKIEQLRKQQQYHVSGCADQIFGSSYKIISDDRKTTTFKFTITINNEERKESFTLPFRCFNIIHLTDKKNIYRSVDKRDERKYQFAYSRANDDDKKKGKVKGKKKKERYFSESYDLLTVDILGSTHKGKEEREKIKYSTKLLMTLENDGFPGYNKLFEVSPRVLMLRKNDKIFKFNVTDDSNSVVTSEFSCPLDQFLKNSKYLGNVDDRHLREYDMILLPTPPGEVEFVKKMILENTNLISQVVQIITTLIFSR